MTPWLRLSPCDGSQPGCPHLQDLRCPTVSPRSGCHLSSLPVGDPLSQPPLGVRREVGSRLCQGI